MDAIILTREDADHVKMGLRANIRPPFKSHQVLTNGSEGVSWISVIPTDTLEYLLAEFTNNSAELDDEGLKLLSEFSSEFHNRP